MDGPHRDEAATATTGPGARVGDAAAPTTADPGAADPGAADAGRTTVPGPGPPAHTAARRAVADLLLQYDRALTAMSSTTTGTAAGTAGRTAWDAVVVTGSALDTDVVGRTARRGADGLVVRPAPDGLGWRHRLVELGEVTGDAVAFSWCGVSFGIVVDEASGAVVDDAVGHSRGTGEAIRDGRSWRLARLDEVDLVILDPGSDDPCG